MCGRRCGRGDAGNVIPAQPPKPNFLSLSLRCDGLIIAAGVVAGIGTVCGYFGSYSWVLDLFSHFRVQYLVGLTLVALLLLVLRKRKSAVVFGVFAIANLWTVFPLFSGKPVHIASSNRTYRALLSNVNTANEHPERVAAVIRQYNPDIVVLEEISDKWVSDLRETFNLYPYKQVEPRDDNFGIALLSRVPFTKCDTLHSRSIRRLHSSGFLEKGNKISRIAPPGGLFSHSFMKVTDGFYAADDPINTGEIEAPSIVAEIQTEGGNCTILATHPPPPVGSAYSRQRNGQFSAISEYVRNAKSEVLLLGDLNTSPWSPFFRQLLLESGLRDGSQGLGIQPTWPTANSLFRIPLDHCLHSPNIQIISKKVGPDVGSDHFPIIVDFQIVTH